MRRAAPALVPDEAPLALVQAGSHGIRITAVNERAAREGVRVGQALADARAALPALLSRTAEPRRDRAALLRLARWCGRYGPSRHADGEDGLWIEVTGVAHLFGGEARLITDLNARLARFSLTARAALADTLGAAHALARFASASATIAPPGETEAQLAPIPVEALRLAPETVLLLRRLGLKRIGQLYALPRAALQRRFRSADAAQAVLARLDQALGVKPEPRRPLAEPPALFVTRAFADPLISAEGLEAETGLLAQELCASLDARHLGARRIGLSLYRADGSVAEARAGLSFPCRSPEHLLALLKEKLGALDAGFGVDALVLAAVHVERRSAEQTALGPRLGGEGSGDTGRLIDRLSNRLGVDRVLCLEPRASHLPERAEVARPALHVAAAASRGETVPTGKALRPPFLLPAPELIDVIAEVPEGPPARFTWRRVERRVARAEGPERIAPEWWREIGAPIEAKASRTRDYYRIEDEAGAGYWVFREGLYGRDDGAPAWFLHGVFA
jgi:protein ImuB